MSKATYIIKTEDDLAPCIALIKERLKVEPLEVVVSPESKQRSVMQNRLYWLWVTQIANHLGEHKDDAHIYLKRRFAVPISIRDDEGYAKMVTTVKGIRKGGMELQAEILASEITRLTSTTDFTVPQMSEYLHDVEMYAAGIGAELTFPEDLIQYK